MVEEIESTIAKNLERIERNLVAFPQAKLVAVSKLQPLKKVIAYAELCRERSKPCILGENYVQEWRNKRAAILAANSSTTAHMIGPLQRNKTPEALKIFDLIQSVGRTELLQEIEKRAVTDFPILLQINISDDSAKSGFDLERIGDEISASVMLLKQVRICGVMAIPKEESDPEITRFYFRKLRQLRDSLVREFSQHGHSFAELSMGMSNDYQIALEEGATMIRIGSALFGERAG